MFFCEDEELSFLWTNEFSDDWFDIFESMPIIESMLLYPLELEDTFDFINELRYAEFYIWD